MTDATAMRDIIMFSLGLITGFILACLFRGGWKLKPESWAEECRKCKSEEAYKELTGEK